ncbi:hypothetical protein [Paraburkholderia aspalathi]|nr:hypothetical protein [Paraburkholderia aspalathi]
MLATLREDPRPNGRRPFTQADAEVCGAWRFEAPGGVWQRYDVAGNA